MLVGAGTEPPRWLVGWQNLGRWGGDWCSSRLRCLAKYSYLFKISSKIFQSIPKNILVGHRGLMVASRAPRRWAGGCPSTRNSGRTGPSVSPPALLNSTEGACSFSGEVCKGMDNGNDLFSGINNCSNAKSELDCQLSKFQKCNYIQGVCLLPPLKMQLDWPRKMPRLAPHIYSKYENHIQVLRH